MTLHTAILVNAFLGLGAVLAVAATTLVPFTLDTLDRRRREATVYAFATPLPEELAA